LIISIKKDNDVLQISCAKIKYIIIDIRIIHRDKNSNVNSSKSNKDNNNTNTNNFISNNTININSNSNLNKHKTLYIKSGYLPNSIISDQDKIIEESYCDKLTNSLLDKKGTHHFIIMTSDTDYFQNYEDKFYTERFSNKYNLSTKPSKKINKKLLAEENNEVNHKIQEYELFKKLIRNFQLKDFKYVSYVFRGYVKVHEKAVSLKVPLLNHNTNSCELCKELGLGRSSNKKVNNMVMISFNNVKVV